MPRKKIIQNIVEYNKAFPTALRQIMQEHGTTQEELAAALGVKRQTISGYADGSSSPNWEGIAAIAQYFDVSADWLLGASDVRTTQADIKAICEYTGLSEGSLKAILRETAQDDTRRVLNIILGFDPASFHRMVRYANLGITIGEKYKYKSINWELIPHEIRAELFECLGINPEGLDFTIDHTRERYFTRAKESLHTVLLSWLASPDGKPLLYEDDTMEGSGTDGND